MVAIIRAASPAMAIKTFTPDSWDVLIISMTLAGVLCADATVIVYSIPDLSNISMVFSEISRSDLLPSNTATSVVMYNLLSIY